ncbi:MAG: rod shape-determining protein RodA [Elusimicrobiota bacterium]|nr:rod shape-determining protein RodA [Elusimicrobiota bacterium]
MGLNKMIIKLSGQVIKRRRLDYMLLAALVLLIATGFLVVLSAAGGLSFGREIIHKYISAVPLAAGAFIFGWLFNYQIYNEQWKAVYVFILALLGAVLFAGAIVRNTSGWFRLGSFSVQPAEICRIALVLVAAAFLTRNSRNVRDFKTLVLFGMLIAPAFLLIMLQPDFSSLVITAPALLILLYAAGVNLFYFALLGAFALAAGVFPILWTFTALRPEVMEAGGFMYIIGRTAHSWVYALGFCAAVLAAFAIVWQGLKQFRVYLPAVFVFIMASAVISGFWCGFFVNKHLKNYQRKRIEAFLSPETDPKGAGYNVLQARIAMGAGGVTGKGLFSGTQSKLGFVPEKHTDFILAVLGEELGLLGTLCVLALYMVLLWRTAAVAGMAGDRYGGLVCCGVFGIFFTYMTVNFGMLIGFVPVAGVPLPFISYGGSNLVASMWAFGLVESVYSRRLTMV